VTDWPPRIALRAGVRVMGASVRYTVLGDIDGSGERDLLLVHGSGAHSAWWHAVVPLLDPSWRVIAVDLSGHGDSGHRPHYDGWTWAAELLAVLDDAQAPRPVVAAHSLGGRVALLASRLQPERVAGLVLLDVGIWAPEGLRDRLAARTRDHVHRISASAEEAVARFRVNPPQPQPPRSVLDPVARYGLRRVESGWTWKHDPAGFPPLYEDDVASALATALEPLVYVSGSASSVVTDDAARRAAALVPHASLHRLAGTHHHLPLERPREIASIIDTVTVS